MLVPLPNQSAHGTSPGIHAVEPTAQPGTKLDRHPIASGSASFVNRRLVTRGSHEMAIGPNLANHLLTGVFLLIGVVVAGVLIATKGDQILANADQMWPLAVLLLFVIGGGFMFFGQAATQIDRASRTITYGSRWRRKTRTLGDVQAVQVVPGNRAKTYQPYELNLAFGDGQRINLSNHANLQWTHKSASSVGDFLGIPVVGFE